MLFPWLHSIMRRIITHWPVLLCAATWTILLTLTVALASFAPEFAFVSSISFSSFSRSCFADGFVRIPLDFPRESVCLPSHMVKRSGLDFFVPTVFAALVVAGSTCLLRSLGFWESAVRIEIFIHGFPFAKYRPLMLTTWANNGICLPTFAQVQASKVSLLGIITLEDRLHPVESIFTFPNVSQILWDSASLRAGFNRLVISRN